jgi:hypothetical protein
MQDQQLGAADTQPAWVHVYVRKDGKWRLAARGWQEPGSKHLVAQTHARYGGAPLYVVRWDPVSGRLSEGLFQPPRLWVPVPDGMAAPGRTYRWSTTTGSGTQDQRAEQAQYQGFMMLRVWPPKVALIDDWPAEDRDPARWRYEGTLPEGVPPVQITDSLVWVRSAMDVPRGWVRAAASWLGGGGTYRLSAKSTMPVAQVRDNMAKDPSFASIEAWGPTDPWPSDWPAEDRGPDRNRFQVTVRPGSDVTEVRPMLVWAWSVPSAAAAAAAGWT